MIIQEAGQEAAIASAHVGASWLQRDLQQDMKPSAVPPIRFDPQRRAGSEELRAAIKSLVDVLERGETELGFRKRARKKADGKSFRVTVEAIACNLAALTLVDSTRPLAVPRSSGVMWGRGRYRNPVYGQHFLDALNLMARPEVGLIEEFARGYRCSAESRQLSTIKATEAFAERIPPTLVRWDAFNRAEEPEVLILKRSKGSEAGTANTVSYRDTRRTRALRKEIQQINRCLRAAPIKIAGDGEAIGGDDDGNPIDRTRCTVRRIFNNGSWEQGGRLFDGFWETMPRADRFRLLRICTREHPEGEPIANVDFSQMFPRLAYRLANHPAPDEDLYDIIGGGLSREGFKKLINALLFAEGPMTRWPRDTSALFGKGSKLKDALALIRHEHAPIADMFGTGIGYRLMFIESNILIEALQDLYAANITALPLHDSGLDRKVGGRGREGNHGGSL